MAKNEAGTIVARRTVHVPQPDNTIKSEVMPVRFQPKTGSFHMAVPDHIVQALGTSCEVQGFFANQGAVVAKQIDHIEKMIISVMREYQEFLQNNLAEKVLVVILAGNSYHPPVGTPSARLASISFAEGLALSFKFAIQWRINDRLYCRDSGGHMTYLGDMPKGAVRKTFVMAWTAERESTLQSAQDSLNRIIYMLSTMVDGDVAANIDLLASQGGLLALAAPTKE